MAGRAGGAIPTACERPVAFLRTVAGTFAAAAERAGWAAGLAVATEALVFLAAAARTARPAIAVRIARW